MLVVEEVVSYTPFVDLDVVANGLCSCKRDSEFQPGWSYRYGSGYDVHLNGRGEELMLICILKTICKRTGSSNLVRICVYSVNKSRTEFLPTGNRIEPLRWRCQN
jgi:hypothetical protein